MTNVPSLYFWGTKDQLLDAPPDTNRTGWSGCFPQDTRPKYDFLSRKGQEEWLVSWQAGVKEPGIHNEVFLGNLETLFRKAKGALLESCERFRTHMIFTTQSMHEITTVQLQRLQCSDTAGWISGFMRNETWWPTNVFISLESAEALLTCALFPAAIISVWSAGFKNSNNKRTVLSHGNFARKGH